MKIGDVFKEAAFGIGGIAVLLKTGSDEAIFMPPERYPLTGFRSGPKDAFEFTVYGCRNKVFPPLSIKKKIFTNELTWSLYEREDGKLLWLDSESPEVPSDRMAVLDLARNRGDIYCRVFDKDRIYDPLSYPFDQIFMIQLLSKGIGFIVHACAVDHKGAGLLFVGNSGAGKTTTANLWGEDSDTKILSDDRIIIRKAGSGFRIYGTPWHGTGKFAKPDDAPLKKIFFLKHGSENGLKTLTASEASSRLISAAFLPFWDGPGMEFILRECSEIFCALPAYELTFKPDKSVPDFIKTNT